MKIIIIIEDENSLTKIKYDTPNQLSEILEFEGKRLESLIDKKLISEHDVRYWDDERKITVRER